MDICDRAQIQIERAEAALLARRRREENPGPGRARCIDCDQKIPVPRRAALPGVVRCVECADLYERRLRSGAAW